jgi:hypothetical protein
VQKSMNRYTAGYSDCRSHPAQGGDRVCAMRCSAGNVMQRCRVCRLEEKMSSIGHGGKKSLREATSGMETWRVVLGSGVQMPEATTRPVMKPTKTVLCQYNHIIFQNISGYKR